MESARVDLLVSVNDEGSVACFGGAEGADRATGPAGECAADTETAAPSSAMPAAVCCCKYSTRFDISEKRRREDGAAIAVITQCWQGIQVRVLAQSKLYSNCCSIEWGEIF